MKTSIHGLPILSHEVLKQVIDDFDNKNQQRDGGHRHNVVVKEI